MSGPRPPSLIVLAIVALCITLLLIGGVYVVKRGETPEAQDSAFLQVINDQQTAARLLWLSNGDVNAGASYPRGRTRLLM